MPSNIKIEGLPELHRSLTGLSADLNDMTAINRTVAEGLVAEIAGLAPRDTGRLAASFSAKGDKDSAEASSELAYAPCQEYGVPSHNIEGLHYAERALAASTAKVQSDYDQGLQKLCRKAET